MMSIRIVEKIGLYVHLPWCVKKCPYCDFNSHPLRSEIDEATYVKALLNDLASEMNTLDGRRVISTIFIGGGTPSLFSDRSIEGLLSGIETLCCLDDDIEITLEANPGTVDQAHFRGYRRAGVNRLSIGVQSFNARQLQNLGRIHDPQQAVDALAKARGAGFDNINLDLMYCLPQQTAAQAQQDIERAVALEPSHLSAYHLTIEPNTLFARQPPELPDEQMAGDIQHYYLSVLKQAGYEQYEVSAFSRAGKLCRHNLNYWRFGDYLGIGAGAHGKLTYRDGVYRSVKPKHPIDYLKVFAAASPRQDVYRKPVCKSDLPLEYMMNKLRLEEGFTLGHFESATGLERSVILETLDDAQKRGLLIHNDSVFTPSRLGKLFLDDLLQLFLPKPHREVA